MNALSRAIELLRHERAARESSLPRSRSRRSAPVPRTSRSWSSRYDRFHSAWAIGLILFAELRSGHVARAGLRRGRGSLVAADLHGRRGRRAGRGVRRDRARRRFAATVLLASARRGRNRAVHARGAGGASRAWWPGARLPAATALYGAIADLGFIVGPALAAACFAFGGPEVILSANAVTFAISALALACCASARPRGRAGRVAPGPASCARHARAWRSCSGWRVCEP